MDLSPDDENLESFRPDTDRPRPWTLLAQWFDSLLRPVQRKETPLECDADEPTMTLS